MCLKALYGGKFSTTHVKCSQKSVNLVQLFTQGRQHFFFLWYVGCLFSKVCLIWYALVGVTTVNGALVVEWRHSVPVRIKRVGFFSFHSGMHNITCSVCCVFFSSLYASFNLIQWPRKIPADQSECKLGRSYSFTETWCGVRHKSDYIVITLDKDHTECIYTEGIEIHFPASEKSNTSLSLNPHKSAICFPYTKDHFFA